MELGKVIFVCGFILLITGWLLADFDVIINKYPFAMNAIPYISVFMVIIGICIMVL